MARIAPFYGLRYNPEKINKMEDVVSPPYDVIDVQAQIALQHKNPYNMIQLDLSKNVGAAGISAERYDKAKETFERWQKESVLIKDNKPAIYLYFTDYLLPSGLKKTRKGFVALTGLAEFSEGIVKPHEKTFRGVTTDRLRLIDTCQAQFSQIFSLYSDPQGEIIACLEKNKEDEPICSVSDQDGCVHTIWPVYNPEAINKVKEIFKDKSIYIADGHHRYTTSLQLRELVRERQGEVSCDSPYDHTMMYLCGMEDPGLSVLPTHRLVRIPFIMDVETIAAKLAESFVVEEIIGGSRESLMAEVLDRMDENDRATMFGFYHPGTDRCFLLTLKDGVMEETCSGKQPETLQGLDVVVLSELVIECTLGLSHEQCESDSLIDYFADPDEAMDVAVKESAGSKMNIALFLMNPPLVDQVRKVADESLIMPHKSTYFYPKVLTGLLLHKIDPDQKIS